VQAVNLLASPLFTVDSGAFIERIVALRLPAVHQWPEVAEEGGLLGYGPRLAQTFRQRARLVAGYCAAPSLPKSRLNSLPTSSEAALGPHGYMRKMLVADRDRQIAAVTRWLSGTDGTLH
jgi:hypothetical protein